MDEQEQPGRELAVVTPGKLNNVDKALAVRRSKAVNSGDVPHISFDDVRQIVAASPTERDRLIIRFLFESCLRVTEAINARPDDIVNRDGGWQVRVLGKGKKRRATAISPGLAADLQAYAYRKRVEPDAPLFPISRSRVFQVVQGAMRAAGVVKPDGVGAVHVLRHSGAIHRLMVTGNPRAVQHQLGHSQVAMTLRYMKTLDQQESMRIQQGVNYDW